MIRADSTHVATLIAPAGSSGARAAECLAAECLAAVASVLPEAGEPAWLASGIAADIPFAPPRGSGNPRWTEQVRSAMGGARIDVVVQPLAGRRKRLLVADMDSTIIEEECIDELAELAGCRAEVAAITQRAMRGEADFESSLRRRVALLAGLHVEDVMRVVRERTTLKPGAVALVRTMRAHGALTAIASGGFGWFTEHVAQRAGFDRHYSNTLVVEHGRLTGALREPVFGRTAKRDVLVALREEHALAPEETLAVGDGANDLAMLEEAGLGVAFHAKPQVAAVARARIEHADLTALLYLQGYTLADIVA